MKNIFSIFVTTLLISQTANSALLNSKTKKGFNPNIGLNALFEYVNSTDSHDDGFSLSEVELQFSSDIDTYLRGEATIAIHKEHAEEGEEGEEHEHEAYAIEPEEVFVETISLPSVTLKFGKFFLDAGKFNTVHSHARMFVSKSTLEENIFGDESLSQVGASASYLLPTSFFSEFTVQAFTPNNDEAFGESNSRDIGFNARFKSLVEINDSSALDFGMTYLRAENKTEIIGADFSYRFTSVNSSSKSHFSIINEFLKKKLGDNSSEVDGVSSSLKYQLSSRTFAQYRFESLGISDSSEVQGSVNTVLLAFTPSEFSSVRMQYDDFGYSDEKKLTIQLNISMGAHPAHAY